MPSACPRNNVSTALVPLLGCMLSLAACQGSSSAYGDSESADPAATPEDREADEREEKDEPDEKASCACNSARTTWPSMLALPWLLFFLRLRVAQEPRHVPGSRLNKGSSGDTWVDAAPGNTLPYDPSLLEPHQCTMLRTPRP